MVIAITPLIPCVPLYSTVICGSQPEERLTVLRRFIPAEACSRECDPLWDLFRGP